MKRIAHFKIKVEYNRVIYRQYKKYHKTNKQHFCSRRSLFTQKSLLPHFENMCLDWSDNSWNQDSSSVNFCKKSITTFPVSWMISQFVGLHGKIYCPKCNTKIGTYVWENGEILLKLKLLSCKYKIFHICFYCVLSFYMLSITIFLFVIGSF